jgi:quinol monooxygenase YgiN
MTAVEAPSRALPGVVEFDVSRSLTDPDSFLATEVFADRTAFELQNAQAEVAALLELIGQGALTQDYEWTTWEAAS